MIISDDRERVSNFIENKLQNSKFECHKNGKWNYKNHGGYYNERFKKYKQVSKAKEKSK